MYLTPVPGVDWTQNYMLEFVVLASIVKELQKQGIASYFFLLEFHRTTLVCLSHVDLFRF